MKFTFLEKRTELTKTITAMLLAVLYLGVFMAFIIIYGLTIPIYSFLSTFGILLWVGYSTVAKPKDKSMLYIIAVLFSSMFVTVTNLSHDELLKIVGEITLSDYVYVKVLSNFIGWIFLPLCALKLATLVNDKQEK